MTSRVVVFDNGLGLEDASFAALEQEDRQLVRCSDSQTLLEEVLQRRVDAAVFGIRSDSQGDLAILHLLRRVAPDLPLILLAAEGSLSTQRLVQSIRPIYYAVVPIETGELREAVQSALARPRPATEGLRKLGR